MDEMTDAGWRKSDCALIFALAVALFTIALPREFLGMDARFAVFAQEMLRNGPTLFPTSYGKPYPDYPAAGTVLIWLCSLPMGRVTQLTLTLPTAIASALILVVIYLLGAVHSRRWGIAAVLLAISTMTFLNRSRCVSLDQFVSLAAVTGFYLAYTADVYGKRRRLWFVPLVLVGGFLIRGLIGTVVPAAAVCCYYAVNKDFRRLAAMAGAAAAVGGLCLAGLLAAAYDEGGVRFLIDVVKWEVTGRLGSADLGGHAWHYHFSYYWITSFWTYAMGYPLALAVIAWQYRNMLKGASPRHRLLKRLSAVMLVVMAGMSLAGDKRIRYILPAVPAMALVGSYLLLARDGIWGKIKDALLRCCIAMAAGVCIYGAAGFLAVRRGALSDVGHGDYAAAAVLTGVTAAAGLWLYLRLRDDGARDVVAMAVGAMTMAVFVICISEPAVYYQQRSAPFVKDVEAMLRRNGGTVVFYRMDADEETLMFVANSDGPLKTRFIWSPGVIARLGGSAYLVSREEDVKHLPEDVKGKLDVVGKGRFVEEDYVVAKVR